MGQSNMASKIRQNFHEESEALINKQINMEFYASYVYLSMSSWFNQVDKALPGFAKYFAKASEEEKSSSRTSPNRPQWSGAVHWMRCRQLWSCEAEPKADADAYLYGGYYGHGLGYSGYYGHGLGLGYRYYGKREAEPKADADAYLYGGYYGHGLG